MLECDPALSVRLLRTVNSAAFAPRRRVEDVGQAVALLGFGPLESLVLSAATSAAIPQLDSGELSTQDFWQMSAQRAAAIGGHHGAAIEGHEIPPAVTLVSGLRRGADQSSAERMVELARTQFNQQPDEVMAAFRSGAEAAQELVSLLVPTR